MRLIVLLFVIFVSQPSLACLFDTNCEHSDDDLEHFRKIHGMTPVVTLKVFSDANVEVDKEAVSRAAKRYLDRLSRLRCSRQREPAARAGKRRSFNAAAVGPRVTIKIRLPSQGFDRSAAEAAVEPIPEPIPEPTTEPTVSTPSHALPLEYVAEPELEFEFEPINEPLESAHDTLLPLTESPEDPIDNEDPLVHAHDCNCLFCESFLALPPL